MEMLKWGLIPSWADDPGIGARMINARSETVAEKPSFRRAFKERRCLIPADGFYEWQRTSGGKQPYYLRTKSGRPFAFAGLWESWDGDGSEIHSCTILTTDANDLVGEVHHRMPVILPPETTSCGWTLTSGSRANSYLSWPSIQPTTWRPTR